MNSRIVPAFDLGRILLTRGIDALNIPKYDVLWLLRQHTCCQWQMEAEDIGVKRRYPRFSIVNICST